MLVLLVLLSGTGCGFFDDDALPPMTLERIEGGVRVMRGSEEFVVKGQFSIEPRDVIQTMRNGLADFSLEGDRRVKLGHQTRVRVTSTSALESLEGSLLAEAGEPTRVRFGTIEARSPDGTFRIDTGFASVRAASFDGDLGLTVAGEPPLTVKPYFEARVAANDLPGTTAPYRLEPSDVFDRDHLSKWIELDRTLNQLGDGLANQLGRSRPQLGYFSDLAEGANVRFMRPYLRRPPVDLLIGLSIAMNSETGLRPAFQDAFDYLDQGAVWGIVAAILRADNTRSVVAQVRGAIEATGAVAQGEGSAPDFVATSGGSSSGTSGGASGDSGGGGSGGDGGSTGGGTEQGGGDEPSPPPDDGCQTTIDCTLQGLGIQPSPEPTGILSDT
ncbi:MAG: hypothetical protein GEU78_07015 [Actinobacteria bacterium]|nr:hypothetical protein [Actinomycetota bacterium]